MIKKQVKTYAEPELADAFKALCEKGGTSVAAELSAYMRKRTRLKNPTAATGSHADRRWQRKATVRKIIRLLEKVRDAEESYRGNMPENLSGGPMAEASETTVERLTVAIEELAEAYA
jgi:hypothetical protein